MNIDLSNVPNTLGVYYWKNKLDKVIYIGKSKNLRTTMGKYIEGNLTPRNKVLLSNINSFEFFTFDNEREALLFEQQSIQDYEPIFNIKIRPNKIYPYIEVKTGKEITFTVSKTKKHSKAIYYGPFPDGKVAREIINMWKVMLDITGKENLKEQKEIIESINEQYSGRLRNSYTSLLKKYKEGHDVEKELDILRAIDLNTNRLYDEDINIDVFAYFAHDDLLSIATTYVRKGVKGITSNCINKLFNPLPEEGLMAYISRYYSRNPLPDKVIIPFELNWDLEIKTKFVKPENDKEIKLMNETILQAEFELMSTTQSFLDGVKEYGHALDFMKKNTDIRSNAKIIEVLKITEEEGYKLATFTQFLEGKERLRGYKKYILTNEEDELDAAKKHIANKKKNHLRQLDILIVNGKEALEKIRPLFENDYTRSLISIDSKNGNIIDTLMNDEYEEFEVEFNSHIYNLLTKIKKTSDKLHKGYHRPRSKGYVVESKLDSFKFLNEIEKQKLVKHFKSYKKIMEATSEELGKIISRPKVMRLIKQREEI